MQTHIHIHTNMVWLLQWHKERKVTHQKQKSPPNVVIVTQPLSPTVSIPLCLHPSQSYSCLIIIKTLILSEQFITNTHFPFPPQRWPALQRTILQHLLPPVLVGQHPCLLTGGCVSDNPHHPPPPSTATQPPSPPHQLPLPEPPGGRVGLKHGELYSRKGACPNRTSGPFNGRPRPGIRPPLLGPRRVLQHRHANISSGRPKWKTQTRNIEISSERGRKGGGQ